MAVLCCAAPKKLKNRRTAAAGWNVNPRPPDRRRDDYNSPNYNDNYNYMFKR